MRLLILLLPTVTIAACCIVPTVANPMQKPPLPVAPYPRVAPYKWNEASMSNSEIMAKMEWNG
jgi:hypothetical protein